MTITLQTFNDTIAMNKFCGQRLLKFEAQTIQKEERLWNSKGIAGEQGHAIGRILKLQLDILPSVIK